MGMTQDAYNQLAVEINSINESNLIGKNRTMNAILGETAALVVTANEDRSAFEAIPRFDISNIDSLQLRLDGFLYCYSQYEDVVFDKSEAYKNWNSLEERAYSVKKKLLRRLMILAEEAGDTEEILELKKIKRGHSREDLTMDFLLLSEKARKREVDLATLNYLNDEITEVENIFTTLKQLLGLIVKPKEEIAELKLVMEKAYTYLQQAVNPIKKYGTMIFEGTDREDLYRSKSLMENGAIRHDNDE